MMGYGSGMGGGMFYGLLMMLGLIVLVVVAIWAIGGGFPRRGSGGAEAARRIVDHPDSRARELLAERYARGELSTEEYQERLRVLEQRA